MGTRRLLGETAVGLGLLSPDELDDCLAEQVEGSARGRTERLGQILLRRGLVTPVQLERLLEGQGDTLPRAVFKEDIPGPGLLLAGGKYRLIRELGAGGAGAVFLAEDVALGRVVAVKMITLDTQVQRERFFREARYVAALAHPNVVKIHDVVEWQGRPLIVMEYVEGCTLRDAIGTFSRRRLLTILRDVAEAVRYVHERGIIHRDLKPANVLLDGTGERPRLTDFGIARGVVSSQRLTQTGALVGTPAYMAPEQITDETVDERTDVYSLGVILYEILTGRAPFEAKVVGELIGKIVHEEPERPSRIRPGVDAELEAICLKAIDKRPERRYPTAAAFAEDLGRYLRGEDPAARKSRRGRAARFLRRHGAAAALALAAGGLVALVALAWLFIARVL